MKKLVLALALISLPAFAANGSWTSTKINATQTLWGISVTAAALATTTTPLFTPSGTPAAELSFLVRPVSGTATTSASIFGKLNSTTPSATVIGTYGVGTGQFGGSITTITNNQLGQYGLTVTTPSPSTQVDAYVLERTLNATGAARSTQP